MKRIIKTRRTLCMALPLLLLPLCAGLCSKDPAACHKILTVVNQSDSTISIARLGHYNNQVSLGCIEKVSSNDTVEIRMSVRSCLEELLSGNEPATNFTVYALPQSTPNILTTMDSLEMVYDILKIIDLAEMGVDSLKKTNFTVYYP